MVESALFIPSLGVLVSLGEEPGWAISLSKEPGRAMWRVCARPNPYGDTPFPLNGVVDWPWTYEMRARKARNGGDKQGMG